MITLHTWQVAAGERQLELLKAPVTFNLSSTGTGKTYVTAWALGKAGVARPLVIAPKSVLPAWQEVLGLAGVVPAGIWNWEQIKTGRRGFWDPKGQVWSLDNVGAVVVDEFHRGASGPKSQITRMAALLKAYDIPKVLLSATLADSPLKMRASGYLANMHRYMLADYYHWCGLNGCTFDQYTNRWDFCRGPRAQEIMSRLHTQLAPMAIRLTYADAPGFPETVIESKLFDLDEAEVKRVYEEFEERLKLPGANPMVEVLRARQRTEIYKVPILAELVNQFVSEGNSVAVFLCFHDTMDRLASLLSNSVSVVQIRGDRGGRTEALAAFQDNRAHVCLAQQDAGGLGVSLHDVHKARPRVALLTPGFSASAMRQCLGRVWRDGGTKSLQLFVMAAGTVEERVHRALRGKFKNLDSLNGLEDEDLI
jgi:hypothetical protein